MDSSFFFRLCATATFFTLLIDIFIKLYRNFRFHEEDRITDASSSSSLSLSYPISSQSRNWTYHVFPSFHGADVRKSFLSHIQKEFRRKGIDQFLDNHIKRSKSIGPELEEAIRGSKIAIVLFSKNYASSSWCLNELVEIMNCREKFGQTVMTIFYEVDPTDVKKQTGSFGKVFNETCKGKTKEEIMRWRKALEGASTIAGEHSRNWDNEADMIEKITTDVSNMLNYSTPSRDFDGLVGMGAHMENMRSLLRLDDQDEVRMIGIWGPSGIGKTTIARFLFNQVSTSFQLSTIMVNIKGCYPKPCLDEYSTQLKLQEKMLSQMINQKDIMVPHLGIAQERLKNKKVFLVLDDVDQLGQLEAMAKEIWWFGPGSRIIITTEDIRVLNAHGITNIYRVNYPQRSEAFQIFCMYAFGQKQPYDGFSGRLAWEAMRLAGELPLGLKVLGSYLRRMSPQEWLATSPRLMTCLDGEIGSVLKFSYDNLCDEDKDLFLYIACFFNYHNTRKVENLLAKRFLDVKQGICVLAEKSLIDIHNGEIHMHNLLVRLGREIARKQYYDDPRKLSILVDQRDICEAFSYDSKDSRRVIGIDLDFYLIKNEESMSEKALERMSNLQFLRFKSNVRLDAIQGLSYRYTQIRYLRWLNSPLICFPPTLNPEFLIELCMPHSNFHKLWEGTKPLKKLKWIDLSYSKNLKELPDLSTATNLEDLILKNCSSLVELPSSIDKLRNLKSLCLSECSRLSELHSFHENIIDLKIIDLTGCSSLIKLPSSIGNAINLQKLSLKRCSRLVEIPYSIENFTNLKEFNICDCSRLVELPSSIGNFTSLKELDLIGCSSLVELPSSFGNLILIENFVLNGCSSLVELPSSIGNLIRIKNFVLNGCSSLVELPYSIGNLILIEKFHLDDCSSLVELPSSIGNFTNLKIFTLGGCKKLVELPSSIGNLTSLQKLILYACSSLVELPSSIGNLTRIEKLNLNDCSDLVALPYSIGNLTSLEDFQLSGCSSLVELPSSIGNLTSLEKLYLDFCSSLVELPSMSNLINLERLILRHCSSLVKFTSLANATNLQILDLSYCSKLVEISSTGNATNLQQLNLNSCSSLVNITFSLRNSSNLEQLDLDNCSSILELPSIENATNLLEMELNYCSNLLKFPSFIGPMNNLQEFSLYNCSSLVEFPSSVGNLGRLHTLRVVGCRKLEVLPDNINLKALEILDFTDCSQLKRFPEISTNIKDLHLVGTAIEEVPSSIKSWTRLNYLSMQYFGNLKEFPHAFDIITELHMSEDVQEVAPWIKEISRLSRIVLNKCKKLVSLPQLPDSLSHLDAENCDSLEILDCSFNNLEICLSFTNCFKLNNAARELIMQTSTHQYVILPGRELPALFNHRATGGYLTVNLNQKPLRTPLRFKACIMLTRVDDETLYFEKSVTLDIYINGFRVPGTGHNIHPVLTEHLYTFEVEVAEEKMTSTKLVFEFVTLSSKWKIRECGVSQIVEVPS